MSEDIPQDADQRAAQAKANVIQHPSVGRKTLAWGALQQRGAPPGRDWVIDHWVGMGHVTLLAGRGGIGKSILAQQMASAIALGVDFVEAVQKPSTVLYWPAEDDHDEHWRRHCAIADVAGVELSAFDGFLHMVPLADAECSLFDVASRGEMVRTSILEELREQIGDYHADLVVLDNIARLFGGSENDRHHVTSFMASLNYAAASTKAAVLLLGHIAKSLNSEFAGSSAWENAARARLWLTDQPPDKPREAGDDEEPKQDLRYLAKRKVNYTHQDLCVLRYQQGCYQMVKAPTAGGLVQSIEADKARRVILSAIPRLDAMGLKPAVSTASPRYLPKLILQYELAEGLTKSMLSRAMRNLMADGVLRSETVGMNDNRHAQLGLVIVNGSGSPAEA